jgi:hypothetical protein
MNWTEPTPGTFRKELGLVEQVYRRISRAFAPLGREHWLLYCGCKLELPGQAQDDVLLGAALRNAWIALRHEFPGLAVLPDGLTAKTYQLPTVPSSFERWADETFVVAVAGLEPDAVLGACQARDVPCMYFFPSTQQVLLLVSHWRVDGLGACMLMDRFLALVATGSHIPPLSAGGGPMSDLERISPTLEDALGSPETDDPEVEAFARHYIAAHHRTAVHAGGLPYAGDATTSPGPTARSQITLNRSSTSTLVSTCKARGVTVTAAVHAALAEAVFALSRERPEKYAAVVSANLRPRLAPPYDAGRQHAVGVYVTGVTPAVDRAQTFGEKARALTAFYRSAAWHTPQFVQALRPIMKFHAAALFDGPPPAKPPSAVTLSSLGVIEGHLGGFQGRCGGEDSTTDQQMAARGGIRVKAFRFGVSILTRQMLLYVWTFGGRLTLSVNYNEAYYSDAAVAELLDSVSHALQEGLGVHLEVEREDGC